MFLEVRPQTMELLLKTYKEWTGQELPPYDSDIDAAVYKFLSFINETKIDKIKEQLSTANF